MFGKKKSNEDAVSQKEIESGYILEVEDLVVHYELEDEIVEAVNGISFKLKREKRLDWSEKLEPENFNSPGNFEYGSRSSGSD